MAPVALVTDSTAYVPPALVEQYGITVVPVYVRFGEEVFRDGVDMTPDQFYARLRTSPDMPATSQPSAGDFVQAYHSLVTEGASGILSIHVSGKLSGTMDSALMARDELPEVPIWVVDSLSTSMGLGLLVLEAARALEAGRPVEEIIRSLETLRERLRLLFVPDTLEFLRRGGRIGGAQAFLGSMLSLKPLLAIRGGTIEAVERVRSKQRAVQRMLDLLAEEAAGRPVCAAVVHASVPQEGEALRQQVQARLDCRALYIAELSPAIGAHAGPGTVGVVICPVVED